MNVSSMAHEKKSIQRVAAWWHFVMAVGALGGVIYHSSCYRGTFERS